MRVVIAEDLVLLREGIAALLADHGHQVVAAVGDGEGLLDAMAEHAPDLAVVDVRMPPTQTDEGVRAAVEARRRRPDAAILILSQYVEERYASDLLSSGTVGVGYLLKDRVADVQEFVAAAERVAAGGTVIDPEVVAQLLGRGRDEPLDALTPREREVLGLMAEGHSNARDRGAPGHQPQRRREARPQGVHQARAARDRAPPPPRARGPDLPGGVR